MIVVVMITLAAWLIVVFYADAHPEWRRRAPSGTGTGTGRQTACPAAPRQEQRGRAAPAT